MKINVAPNGNAEDRRIQSYNPYYSNIIAVGYNILRRYYYVLVLLILCFLYRHARAPRKVLIMRTLWHLGYTVKRNMLNTVINICTFFFLIILAKRGAGTFETHCNICGCVVKKSKYSSSCSNVYMVFVVKQH